MDACVVLQTGGGGSNEPVKSTPPAPKRTSIDESRLEEDWDTLPAWKREIMMKRGGAIRNWGDEREEVNEEETNGE